MFKNTYYLLALLVAASLRLQAANFYVSPTGSPSGDGSLSRPWDLQTALYHPAAVKPGDTIWMRGGIHRQSNRPTKFYSYLAGAAGAPITVRQYPGERATIDGNLSPYLGGWVNFWGFEIMNSYPTRYTSDTGSAPTTWQVNYDGKIVDLCVSGVDLRVPNTKLINLIVHDSIGGGIGISTVAPNPEVYGLLSYYNGWLAPDRGHGHGIYMQSSDPSVAKVQETLLFANYGAGVQAYASADRTDNFYLEGNAAFINSALAPQNKQPNYVIGPWSGTARNPVLIRNFTYDTLSSSADVNIGYVGGVYNATLRSNYFTTSAYFVQNNTYQSVTANTFLGAISGLNQSSYPNNYYQTTTPTANLVEVRPNKYEPGRANIIVYNWQRLNTVAVDISPAMAVGTSFEVRNAQDFFGPPVLSGTYGGGAISLPMTGLTVAKPIAATAPPSTAPAFNVFVLLPRSGGTGDNQPPTVSSIANQTTSEDTPTSPIAFTVSDAETASGNLAVSATSSNPTLVPNANIALGGSGSSRTLTITPAANQSGTATITVSVSDGMQTASTSFALTVNAVNDAPTISVIPNVTIAANTSSGPLPFTVGDLETPAGNLTLLASSSNPTLLPNTGIVLGGSGANRTVTLTPATDQSGTATITISVSDGATTVLRSFGLTVIASTPGQLVYLPIPAEDGTLVTPMNTLTDSQSGSTVYVATLTADQGSVTFPVNITVPGTYVIWSRILGTNASSDSFYVSVDGGTEDVYDAAEGTWKNAWQWTRVNGRAGGAPLTLNPRTFTLAQGTHTIVFRGREAKTGLAQILVSNDPNFVPQDQTPTNQAPTISAIADQTTTEDTPEGPIAFVVGDAETPAAGLTVSANSLNPTLVPNANIVLGGSGANRTVAITPAANQSGSASITLTVSDGTNRTSATFGLTVTPVNDPPTLSAIPDTAITANSSTAPLAFTVGDVETPAASLVVSANSSNPTLVPSANIVFGGSDANRTVTVTPAPGQTGTATITITVSDGQATAQRSFVLTVNPGALVFEAEAGTLVTPMAVQTDTQDATRRYVSTPNREQGSLAIQVNIPVAGTYIIWCQVLAKTVASDSFYVSVDGGAEDIYDVAEGTWSNAWQWTRVNGRAGGSPLTLNPRTFNLSAGTHTILFRGREANTGLDKIMVTSDLRFVP